jgi:hypothetical protein
LHLSVPASPGRSPGSPRARRAILAALLVLAAAIAVLVVVPQAKAQTSVNLHLTAPEGATVVAGSAAGSDITVPAEAGVEAWFSAQTDAFISGGACYEFTSFYVTPAGAPQGNLRPSAQSPYTWIYTPSGDVDITAVYSSVTDVLDDCWIKASI